MKENRMTAFGKGRMISAIVVLFAVLSCGYTTWRYIEWNHVAAGIKEPDKRIQAEREALTTLTQVLGGTFVLLSSYFTARTIQISQEARITNSFFQAMELLGDEDSLSQRIGGLYALERVAWDSEKDHWTVMEVFMSYLRQNAAIDTHKEVGHAPEIKRVEDIHAVVRAIARRKRTYRQGEEHRLDLRGLGLVDADFYYGCLQGILFDGSILDGASFKWANLDNTRMRSTSLQRANFTNASLKNSKLAGANLTDAVFKNAHLEGADLSETIGLTRSQIKEAILDEKTKIPLHLQSETSM